MQVQRIGYRVRGLYRVAGLGVKWGMIAPDTEKRLKILRFWEEHGLKATRAAFEVSRRTLFEWKRRLKAEGARGLAPGSTRPQRLAGFAAPRDP
jgi:Helix-turn-helix domain